MPTVFISYCRKDNEPEKDAHGCEIQPGFVRRLVNALTENEIDTWVDWDDIVPTADWWQMICAGIDAAASFLFILSPNSLASSFCHLELDYARQNTKRIIPIKLCSVDSKVAFTKFSEVELDDYLKVLLNGRNLGDVGRNNWVALSRPDWISFTDEKNNFDACLNELLNAIRTDLDHTERHSRLLVRARDWENNQRNKSFLLSGDDLNDVEVWRDNATGKYPEVLPLQNEYIRESRAAERRRQRNRLTGVTTALISTIIFASLASLFFVRAQSNLNLAERRGTDVAYQASTARFEQGRAENNAATSDANAATATVAQGQAILNANESESLRLNTLSDSILQQNGDPELATLLSILAMKTYPLPEVEQTLLQNFRQIYTVRSYTLPNWANGIVTFSPDGSLFLVAGGYDDLHRAFLVNVKTGEIVQEFVGHQDKVNAVAYSPDSRYIATGSWDHTARLWNANTGEQLRVFEGHQQEVHSVAFSPDGTILLTGSLDGTVRFWDTSTGREIKQLEIFQAENNDALTSVLDAEFSPDGKLFAVVGANGTAQLRDTSTGNLIYWLTGHTAEVAVVAFSFDGKLLITGSGDTTARIWDVETGTLRHQLASHISLVLGAAFSPDGNYALTGSWDGTAILWSTANGEKLRTFQGHPSLFTGDPSLFPLPSAAMVLSVAYSPDGNYILTGSVEDVRLWNARLDMTWRILDNHNSSVLSTAFSPDGKYVATGSADGNTRIWDVQSESLIHQFDYETVDAGGPIDVVGIAFSPDGKLLAVASWNQNFAVRLRDAQTFAEAGTLLGHTNWITSISFSPDSHYILTGSRDNSARLWNAQSLEPVQILSGHTNWVNAVSFSHDGHYAATGSSDGTARIWDILTGESLYLFSGHEPILSVAFSPDDKQLALGGTDDIVHVYNIQPRRLLATLSGHTDLISSIEYSFDGQYILISSYDGTASLWDAHTYQLIRVLRDHELGITDAAFSPDGQLIVTGSLDRTARLWKTNYNDWIDYACARVFRDFSEADRATYRLRTDSFACEKS